MKRLKLLFVCLLTLSTLQAQSILKIAGEVVEKEFSHITLDLETPGNLIVHFADDTQESYNMNQVQVLPNGVIKVIAGDANGDKLVSISDAVATVNKILGTNNPLFYFDAADVNGDKVISITDAVMIVNIILNGDSQVEQ